VVTEDTAVREEKVVRVVGAMTAVMQRDGVRVRMVQTAEKAATVEMVLMEDMAAKVETLP
jgi:hypothetical protein